MTTFQFGDVVVPADDDEAEVYGTEPASVSMPPDGMGWMRVTWDAETIPVRADRWKRAEKAPSSPLDAPAASETPQDAREVARRERWADRLGTLPGKPMVTWAMNEADREQAALVAERDALQRNLAQAVSERDRLRTDVVTEVEAEYSRLLSRQGEYLTDTVNALRGDPPPLSGWSHHDVADLARAVVAQRDEAVRLITDLADALGDASFALLSQRLWRRRLNLFLATPDADAQDEGVRRG